MRFVMAALWLYVPLQYPSLRLAKKKVLNCRVESKGGTKVKEEAPGVLANPPVRGMQAFTPS